MTSGLRGDSLKNSVKAAIQDLVIQSRGKRSKINLSQIARNANTSRTSLYKMRDFVDQCLFEIKKERSLANGNGGVQKLRNKIQALEAKNVELELKINSLRKHHLEIYKRLYANSAELSSLVRPILITEILENESCPLCNRTPSLK